MGLVLLLATLVGCAVPQAALAYEGSGERGGFDPQDLRSAYNLPETGGYGRTIAIIDGGNDPNANEDLAVYRKRYGLPECTEQNGCFTKVNEKGETANYPTRGATSESSREISLDLDMASATCSECHVLLIETRQDPDGDPEEKFLPLSEANDEAVDLGATVVSDSWGTHEGEYPRRGLSRSLFRPSRDTDLCCERGFRIRTTFVSRGLSVCDRRWWHQAQAGSRQRAWMGGGSLERRCNRHGQWLQPLRA